MILPWLLVPSWGLPITYYIQDVYYALTTIYCHHHEDVGLAVVNKDVLIGLVQKRYVACNSYARV